MGNPEFATIPAPGVAWQPLRIGDEALEILVEEGLLQSKELAGSRSDKGKPWPFPEIHEIVVFAPFFLRGFATTYHWFLHGLLFFYGPDLIHLNANSILHISIFIHLCEAFLGIDPHFGLWLHLFRCKVDYNTLVGSATFQL